MNLLYLFLILFCSKKAQKSLDDIINIDIFGKKKSEKLKNTAQNLSRHKGKKCEKNGINSKIENKKYVKGATRLIWGQGIQI
jgi:hypothetical protein